jgi:hypothetical protein
MNFDTDTQHVVARILIAWAGAIIGMTVSQWAALAALIYTCLQIYITMRDKIFNRRK